MVRCTITGQSIRIDTVPSLAGRASRTALFAGVNEDRFVRMVCPDRRWVAFRLMTELMKSTPIEELRVVAGLFVAELEKSVSLGR